MALRLDGSLPRGVQKYLKVHSGNLVILPHGSLMAVQGTSLDTCSTILAVERPFGGH